jgi:hypothetical protein
MSQTTPEDLAAATQLAEQRHYDLTVAGAEWNKKEQIERMKTRSQLAAGALGSLFLIAAGAFQNHAVLLAFAPVGAVLGWLWLGEDRKTTEIGSHLVRDIVPILTVYTGGRSVLLWEIQRRNAPRRLSTKLIDLAMMLLLYVGPGFVGTAAWDILYGRHGAGVLWFAWLVDLALLGVMTWQFIANADVDWNEVRARLAKHTKRFRRPQQPEN